MPILINILLTLHVIVSLLIIFVTLMQRPKNEGLGAAFGGGMTADLFGAQTSNVLANFTRWLGGLFFGLTLLLSVLYARNSAKPSDIKQQLLSAPRVIATPTPAAKSGSSTLDKNDKAVQGRVINDIKKQLLSAPKAAASFAPVGKSAEPLAPIPVKLAPDATPAPLLPAAPIPSVTAPALPTPAATTAPAKPVPAATAPAVPPTTGSKP